MSFKFSNSRYQASNQNNSRQNYQICNQTSKKQQNRCVTMNKNTKISTFSKISANEKIQENGLPNLINTCFLNSVIQSLFPLTQFTKQVQKINFQNAFICYLSNVFQSMKNMLEYKVKKQNMELFIKQLKKIHLDYSGKTQEDAIDFLKMILRQLSYSSKIFMDFFNIIMTQQCKNPSCENKRKTKFNQIHIFYQDQICESCGKPLKKIVLKNPKYLLVLGGDKQKKFSLQNAQSQKICYKLASKNLYSGSGYFGHYVCYRKLFSFNQKTKKYTFKQNQWRYYNDNQIESGDSFYYGRFKTKYSIYQLDQNVNPQNIQRNNLNQNTFQKVQQNYTNQYTKNTLKKNQNFKRNLDQIQQQEDQKEDNLKYSNTKNQNNKFTRSNNTTLVNRETKHTMGYKQKSKVNNSNSQKQKQQEQKYVINKQKNVLTQENSVKQSPKNNNEKQKKLQMHEMSSKIYQVQVTKQMDTVTLNFQKFNQKFYLYATDNIRQNDKKYIKIELSQIGLEIKNRIVQYLNSRKYGKLKISIYDLN